MTFAPHMPFPIGKQEIPEISAGPYTGDPGEGFEPIGPYYPDTDESKLVPLDFLGGFMKDRNLADLSDYRRKWIRHTSGKDVITDPVYRKNLQDIILYPDRFGFNTRV